MLGAAILENLRKKNPDHNHPRLLLLSKDFARIRAHREEGNYKILVDHVVAKADAAVAAPISIFEIRDGIRLLPVSRNVLRRVEALALAYNLVGEEKYAKRAVEEVMSAAAFPNWNPSHFLDVGEMCFAFALCYDWLYDYLSAEQKQLMRTAIIEKALTPAMDDYRDLPRSRTYRWYQHMPGDNWKFVCNGGLTGGILAIADDEDCALYEEVLDCAFDDCYKAVRNFYSSVDGCYVEGLNYWNYASMYLSYYYTSLVNATGSDYGLTDHIGLHKSAYFVIQLCSPDLNFFNFGDAGEAFSCNSLFLWYGHRFQDYGLSSMRSRVIATGSCELDDILYYHHEEAGTGATLPITFGEVGCDNASFRSGWDPDALFAAIHFGTNDVCHGHDDMGTFVVNVGNARFFSELGPDSYNLSPYRSTYRYRAEGHNTLFVDPAHAPGGMLTGATVISRFENGEGKDHFAIADMSSAYPDTTALRGLKMTADKGCIILQDEIKTEKDVIWAAHTRAKVSFSFDRRSVILEREGKRLYVALLSEDMRFCLLDAAPLPSSPRVKGEAPNHAYARLAVCLSGKSEYTVSVAMLPLKDGETEPAAMPTPVPLANW